VQRNEPPNALPSKCNDFVIKNNEFIRDFEGMYQNYDDPWNQRQESEDLAIKLAFCALSEVVKISNISPDSILDVGCADGYYAEQLLKLFPKATYFGTDISPTVISRSRIKENRSTEFAVNDIRVRTESLVKRFDIIFCSKTIYYCAPEIKVVLPNIRDYLRDNGLFCFTYNQQPDSFSNTWLTYKKLRHMLLRQGWKEKSFFEVNRFSSKAIAIGIYSL